MNGRQTASSIFRRQYLLGCWELLRGNIHSLPRAKDVLFSVAFGPFYGSKQKKKKKRVKNTSLSMIIFYTNSA